MIDIHKIIINKYPGATNINRQNTILKYLLERKINKKERKIKENPKGIGINQR